MEKLPPGPEPSGLPAVLKPIDWLLVMYDVALGYEYVEEPQ